VDDLHQATGRDLNLVVGQKYNATVGGEMQERIEGLRQSLAGVSQRFQAPKSWIGSEAVNAFEIIAELLGIVGEMNLAIAAHTHPPLAPPSTSSIFEVFCAQAERLEKLQRTITL